MAELVGVNLAMQTPFNEDGTIDYRTFEDLVDRYIDAGVHGIVFGSGTGQHPYLTEEECNKLYELGAKRVQGRCNVICQTSALNVDEVIRRSKHAESIGANAIMVLPPYFEGPSDDDGLFEFYKEVDASIGIDIIGYNIPQATGIAVSPSLLKRLVELPNYNYIKDSAGDITTHQEFISTGANVLNGCDPTTIFAFLAGAKGAIWGAANFLPTEAVKLYNLVQSGDVSAAFTLWHKMLPSLLFIWRTEYVASVLHASKLRGFGTGRVRKPLRALSKDHAEGLRKALATLEG
ncbi:dihydrodipicolinate synthetase [Caballeronia hypogeia]|uniref:Dihydrodipicolinate synthetase n=1 Tax=Caballeronia hypogeia TaxID=1777140 RepID=A0A158D032_9BURK|nr:dihydrodipicolinate synthase family protein [Caballeronia hypogeia]SAK87710.1 dihydrodipicolinate synthetase [Caballeronia hypogeia]